MEQAVANPHPHPTDLKQKIQIRRKWILAGCITSLVSYPTAKQCVTNLSLLSDSNAKW